MKTGMILLSVWFSLFIWMGCQSPEADTSSASGEKMETNDYTLEDWGDEMKLASRYTDSEEVLEQGLLKDGHREGTWVIYQTTNNFIDTIASYHKGLLHGPIFLFNRAGRLESKGSFKKGMRHGLFVKYDYRYTLEEAEYKNDLLDGTFRSYYKNGNLREESQYREGKRNGTAKYYDEDENLTMQYTYRDNEIVSGGKVDSE